MKCTLPLSLLGALLCTVSLGCAPTNEMHPPREPVLATHADAKEPTPAERDRELLKYAGAPNQRKPDQVGLASWYGRELAGHRTANGEWFDPNLLTAAHKQLPFGTWVEVRRLDTGRSVRVRINDRGPKAKSRVIDLSQKAAEDLDLVHAGVARVELRVVDGPR